MAAEHNYQATTGNTNGQTLEKDFSNKGMSGLCFSISISLVSRPILHLRQVGHCLKLAALFENT